MRIIAWNIRCHRLRRTTVEQLLQTNHIIALQETKLKSKPAYGNNNTFFQPSEESGNAKRGLLIIVKKGIECCQIKIPNNTNGVEALAVSLSLSGKKYVLVNMYVQCDSMKTPGDWEQALKPLLELGEHVIITGDFNARSPLWHDTITNQNGRSLEEAYVSLNGILINSGGPTRYAERQA